MDSNHLLPASEEAKFLNLSYKERWEHLRPVIVEMYMGNVDRGGKPMTIQEVVDFMKLNYSFFGAWVATDLSHTLWHSLTDNVSPTYQSIPIQKLVPQMGRAKAYRDP